MAFPIASEIKIILGITSSTYDTLIATLIPIVKDEVKEYCNNEFVDSNGADIFPDGGKLVFSQMIGYWIKNSDGIGGQVGIKSFSEGGYSETKTDSESSMQFGYPIEIIGKLNKWKYVRTSSGSTTQHWRDDRGLFYGQTEYILPDNTDDE